MFALKRKTDQRGFVTLGGIIRQCRLAMELSRGELAQAAQLDEKTIDDIECGRVEITLRQLQSFASLFGLSITEMVDLLDSKLALIVLEENSISPRVQGWLYYAPTNGTLNFVGEDTHAQPNVPWDVLSQDEQLFARFVDLFQLKQEKSTSAYCFCYRVDCREDDVLKWLRASSPSA